MKKAYANEAWEMVAVDEKYVEWLKKISLSKETNESVKMEQLKEKQRPLKSVVVFVGVDEEGYEFKLTSKVFNF